jgi:hypothetical protein
MEPGAYDPTVAVDAGAVVRMPPMPQPPSPRRAFLIAGFVLAVIIALAIGVGIGRNTAEAPTAVVTAEAAPERGKLKVISTPADSNVILDGRFVGVAPLENLDVEPGKHTIVVDVFGYEPYSGTVEVEPRSNAKVTVVLGPLGEQTTGTVSGRGSLTRLTVPRSALQPAVTAPAGAPPQPRVTTRSEPSRPVQLVPQRPRRDCGGEQSNCTSGCSRADSDCRFSCPGCTSCLTSVGWDECRRQCDTCRNGCEQNKKFCESSCSSQKSSCEASNNY